MKVSELQKHLKAYVEQDSKHANVEVMIKYDGDAAFGILCGENHDAMGDGMSLERFLVLTPDFHGVKLTLKSGRAN